MFKNLDHVGFTVAHLDKALAFYRDLLGLEVLWERVYEEEYVRKLVGYPTLRLRCAFLKLPGSTSTLELLEYQNVPRTKVEMHRATPGNAHLCLAIDDLDKLYERLKTAGVDFVSGPEISTAGPYVGSKVVYLHDPDGISIELVELHKEEGDTMQPQRAFVTGGASGLGYAVAEALLASGASVAIGDINQEALKEAAKTLNTPRLLTVELDVTSRQSVQAAVQQCVDTLNGLDTLVNCAGVIDFVPLEEMTEELWDRIIDIDLKGVFLSCQAAAPFLRGSGRGRIVSISSDAGKKGYSLISSYCAAKFGVIGFSRAIAGELAPYGVTVNCVCPIGVASTRMDQKVLDWLSKRTGEPIAKIMAARAQTTPMNRTATTEDVVQAIMFFISDASNFLTGEALNVDGGVLTTSAIPGIATE